MKHPLKAIYVNAQGNKKKWKSESKGRRIEVKRHHGDTQTDLSILMSNDYSDHKEDGLLEREESKN